MRDLVSVVIPAHNYASYLGGAIESALYQGYRPVEVIVVDDGSTDGTQAVLNRFAREVLTVHLDGRGVAAARNAGLARASGTCVVFLDADDLLLPGGVQAQVEYLSRNPGVTAVYGSWFACDVRRDVSYHVTSPIRSPDLIPGILLGNVVTTPSAMMVRRRALEDAGGFHPALSFAADWNMWLRLTMRGCRFGSISEPVAIYRIHGGSMTGNLARAARDIWYVLDTYFDDPAVPERSKAVRSQAYFNMSVYLGKLHLEQGDQEGARAHLERALALHPDAADSAGFHYDIARAILKGAQLNGQPDVRTAAAAAAQFAIGLVASSARPVPARGRAAAHLAIGLIVRSAGDQHLALRHLRTAIRSSWRAIVTRQHLAMAIRVCMHPRLTGVVKARLGRLRLRAASSAPVPPLVSAVMVSSASRQRRPA